MELKADVDDLKKLERQTYSRVGSRFESRLLLNSNNFWA